MKFVPTSIYHLTLTVALASLPNISTNRTAIAAHIPNNCIWSSIDRWFDR
ncbi:MAG: hypothetical protein ACK47N_06840 [Microcystis sp.]|nr:MULTISPECIES: hypothetical protein [Microcystis]MCZ8121258.1 hypothetical protein [Microcystis sp. LE18-22.4A]